MSRGTSSVATAIALLALGPATPIGRLHHLANEGPRAFVPLVLLAILAVSYVTRPASRALSYKSLAA